MNSKDFKANVRLFNDTKEIVEMLEHLAGGSALDGHGRYWVMEAAVSLEGMMKLLRKAAREGVK